MAATPSTTSNSRSKKMAPSSACAPRSWPIWALTISCSRLSSRSSRLLCSPGATRFLPSTAKSSGCSLTRYPPTPIGAPVVPRPPTISSASWTAARELNLDPAKFRSKNFPQPREFPFTTAAGLLYDSANYQQSLKRALQLAGYDKLRARQKVGWKQGKYYGVGVSTYVEICAIGPSAATPAGGWESATV